MRLTDAVLSGISTALFAVIIWLIITDDRERVLMRELPQRKLVFQLLVCLCVLNFMFLFAQHVQRGFSEFQKNTQKSVKINKNESNLFVLSNHSDDLNAGCLVAAFFTQIPILLIYCFTSYIVIWVGLEVRKQISFLEKATELKQLPVSTKIFTGIYLSSLLFSLIILISTWASNNKDQFLENLQIQDEGNFLCWFGGVTWWIGYFVPYILTVFVSLGYLCIIVYYITSKPKQFQLLPEWLLEDLTACSTFCIFELLSWFFAMWTGLDTVITSVFTWIFIFFKFAAGLAVIVQSVLDMNSDYKFECHEKTIICIIFRNKTAM